MTPKLSDQSSAHLKRCQGCEKFVAILEQDGKLRDYSGLICLGDKKCFNKRPDDKKQGQGAAGKPAAGSRMKS
jgi:hypothetical protein